MSLNVDKMMRYKIVKRLKEIRKDMDNTDVTIAKSKVTRLINDLKEKK